MVRKKDDCWKYVEIVNGRRSCKFCKQLFSGATSISRIKSHLSGVGHRDVQICREVPTDVQLVACKAIITDAYKRKARSTEENVEETASGSCDPPSSPLDVALQSSFKFLPSSPLNDAIRSTLKFNLLKLVPNKLEQKILNYVASVKKSFAVTGCTIMCNMDYDKISKFVHIFACNPKGMVVIDSRKYSIDEVIHVQWLMSLTIETLGSELVTQLILSSELQAYRFMYPQTFISSCASKQIQGLFHSICDDIQWVGDIFSIARIIVAYIHKHNVHLSLEREYIGSKTFDLHQTEFCTEFLMLRYILQFENELKVMQFPTSSTSFSWWDLSFEGELAQPDKYVQALNCIICNNDFWRGVREVVQVFQPIFEVFHLVENYLSSSGYLYEAWKRARDSFKECMNKNQEKYEPIWQKFKHFQFYLIRPIYRAAAFLNPAYMLSENFTEDNEIKEGIDYVAENLIALEEKEAFVTQIQCYRSKDPCTFTTTAKTMMTTTHPRKWWEHCGNHLPELQKYAIRILSQPCSLLSFEQYKQELKSSDNPVLHVNKMLMERYNMFGAQDEGPIDLDSLSQFLANSLNDLNIEDCVKLSYWEDIMSDAKYEGIMHRWL